MILETSVIDGLEVLSCKAKKPKHETPLLFVHGAFSSGWMWSQTFMPYFAEHGYHCVALSLRGHGDSHGQQKMDWHSIAHYVEDVEIVSDWMGQRPALIGHSMGGFVVQKYLERHQAPAVVLMSSAPPQGLIAAQFHLLVKNPRLFMDINRILGGNEDPKRLINALRSALFAQPVEEDVLLDFLRHMRPESHRAIWDMSMFNLPRLHESQRPPLLVLGGEEDLLIPAFLVQATARTYGLQAHLFRGMGHALTHEKEWPLVAALIKNWLDKTLAAN